MSENKSYKSIGLMSGTSLDGVDLVYSEIVSGDKFDSEIIYAKTYEYPEEWYVKLKTAFQKHRGSLDKLHKDYGKYLGKLVVSFIEEFSIQEIDFVASHGHTIFHKPNEGYTLQIGCGEEISKITGCKVVYDFRVQDVELGGQGAPLVPIGDELLFANYDFCLNLGGFVNVSFKENNTRKAFDICPINIVLNHYMNTIDKKYDDKGFLAKTGNVNTELLNKLNADDYFKRPLPKSLGYEFVVENVLPLVNAADLELKDVLRTYTEHVAIKISEVLNKKVISKTLITGGGAFNDFLIERIQSLTSSQIIIPQKELVEFKEALIFSLLAVLRLENKPNCLKSVTGASQDHSSGKVVFIG